MLDPAQRPIRWRRLGSEREHYDIERVGLRFEEVGGHAPSDSREGRLVYDTTREGMGNGGHLYGASLSDAVSPSPSTRALCDRFGGRDRGPGFVNRCSVSEFAVLRGGAGSGSVRAKAHTARAGEGLYECAIGRTK